MKVNRLELINALQAVMPGLSQREIILQSTSFVFTEDGAVVTYNDEIAVSHPIKVNFVGAVPAKEFFAFINKIKTEEIEITASDSEIIVGSKAKAGLRLEPNITLPIQDLAQPEDSDWKKLPKSFCEAASFCMFTVSRDQTKPVLTCLHVNGQYIESTDNYRITRFDMGAEAKKIFKGDHASLLIPAHAAKSIIGYSPISFATTEGWAHFKNAEGLQFSCRIFEEEFPDIEQYMKVSGDIVQFPASLIDILDKASVFSNGERVTISLEEGKLLVTSEGTSGWFKEPARVNYEGESIAFEISPDFMKSIRKITDTAEISKNVMKFSGENFTHIVALIKAKGGK